MLQLDIERELNLRGKQSERQQIRSALIDIFARERSEKVHYGKLEKEGLKLYARNGKVVGIQGVKRRYRLKTLGFDPLRISMERDRLQDLKRMERDRDKDQGLER